MAGKVKTQCGQAVGFLVLQRQQFVPFAIAQQQAGFLEAFADRRDPVGEAALLHTQLGAGDRVIQPRAARGELGVPVCGIERTARKDLHALGESHLGRALHQENVRPVFRVTGKDYRRGGAGDGMRISHFDDSLGCELLQRNTVAHDQAAARSRFSRETSGRNQATIPMAGSSAHN